MKKIIPSAVVLLLVALTLTALAAPGDTTLVSFSHTGTAAIGMSHPATSNADGRYVAFNSGATNLIAGADPYDYFSNIYVRDRMTGEVVQVDVSPAGATANGDSSSVFWNPPVISADGRYVAFSSFASNLAANDGSGVVEDVFLRDLQTGTTTLISVNQSGVQLNAYSFYPSISADGRYVAFESAATNVIPGDTQFNRETYVRDTLLNTTSHVSINSDGLPCLRDWPPCGDSHDPSLSADGRFVVFSSSEYLVAGEGAGIFIHDRQTGTTSSVHSTALSSLYPEISADGRFVVFHVNYDSSKVDGDTNGEDDVIMWDRLTGEYTIVSRANDGSLGNGDSQMGTISRDGRYVAFQSTASNLAPGDTNGVPDGFVRDLYTGTTVRVTVASDGAEGTGHWQHVVPFISADGCLVVFSASSDLVPDITNNYVDVFAHERECDPYPLLPDFFASTTSGTAPLTVSFTNTSLGDYTSVLWDFGDGSISTELNPTHTYQNSTSLAEPSATSATSYTVSLTIYGPDGQSTEVKTDLIAVEEGLGQRIFLPLFVDK